MKTSSKASASAKKKQPTKWTKVSSSLGPDPRVSETNRDPQRFVLVRTLIDDEGRLWEKVGRDEPTLIGRPPASDGNDA